MSDTSSILIKLFVFILFIAVAGFAYYELSRTPLGSALNALFGVVGGILNGIDNQINTCNTVGWFNPAKGCFAGVLGLGVGILYAAFKFIRLFYKGGGSIEGEIAKQQALEPGKNVDAVEAEIMPDIVKVAEAAETKGLSPEMQKAVIEKAGARSIGNKIIETAKENGSYTEQLASDTRASYAETNGDINERNGLDAAEAEDADKFVDDFVPEP